MGFLIVMAFLLTLLRMRRPGLAVGAPSVASSATLAESYAGCDSPSRPLAAELDVAVQRLEIHAVHSRKPNSLSAGIAERRTEIQIRAWAI
jgi:hypothetical protein